MKILIVYDTKYGNNKQVAEFVADNLRKASHDVKVHYAKEISQKDALAFQPEIFLFGGPNHAGNISKTLKRWVSGFSDLLKQKGITLKTTAAWATYMKGGDTSSGRFGWSNEAPKWETLGATVPASKKLPSIMNIAVEGMSGPLESGWQEKINDYIEKAMNL